MDAEQCKKLADLLYPNAKDTSFYFNKYKPRKTSGAVTRLGPSPTGFLHIGQLYQSIIHRLYASKTGGIFFLRLEDTDSKREVENAGEIAYDMLVRFGLKPDEGYRGEHNEIGDYGPYKQSERLEIYHAFAKELVKNGKAFPCFCAASQSKEEIIQNREEELEETGDLEIKDPCRNLTLSQIEANLKAKKPFALRLKSCGDSSKTHEFVDAIKGKKEIRENAKDDVLIKSNGVPVYAFAHVVDDTLMGTTMVIRGQEWYQSAPVHIELAKALNLKPFNYAHTPNICVLDEKGNKRKISKRKDTFADVRFFLKQGYPTTAVIEYLLNLLNSDFENWRKQNPTLPYTEFPFEIGKIGVTNPLFDFLKLNDISKTIISKYNAEEVYNSALTWAKEWNEKDYEIIAKNKDVLTKMFRIDRGGERPRKDITKFDEITSLYDYVLPNFNPTFTFELGNVNKQNLIDFLTDYAQTYTTQADNSAWFENLKQIAQNHNFADNKTFKLNPTIYAGNISDASKFVRLAITGKENSPELFSIMNILGITECKKRINNFIKILKNK